MKKEDLEFILFFDYFSELKFSRRTRGIRLQRLLDYRYGEEFFIEFNLIHRTAALTVTFYFRQGIFFYLIDIKNKASVQLTSALVLLIAPVTFYLR